MSIRVRNGHVIAESQRLAKLAAGDVEPKWQQLFPMGERHRRDFPGGKTNFDKAFFGTMLANWQAVGKPSLMVDYFHKGPGEEHSIADKLASGWIEDLEVRDDGLYGLVKWTEKARGHILADELRYLSPYFAHNATSRLTGKPQGPTLAGAGLLNDPFLQDLPAVAASANDLPRGSSGSSSRVDGDTVNKALCILLGIAEDSDDASIMTALKAKLGEKESAVKLNADVQAKLSANESALKLASEEITKLKTDLTKRDDDAKAQAIADVITKLEAGHHIIADQKDKVTAYAKATSAKEAWDTFSKFSAVPKGEAPSASGGTKQLTAETPEQAYAKLTELAKEKAKADKVSLSDAREALYGEPEMQELVSLASRNHAGEKRKN